MILMKENIEHKINIMLERETYAHAMADKESSDGAAPLAKTEKATELHPRNRSNKSPFSFLVSVT